MAEASIECAQEEKDVIPTNAVFKLSFDEDVTKEYVESTFVMKPYRDLKVSEISPRSYELTAVNGLEEDQVYNIEEKTTSGVKKWAFQTERVFKVEYTYPGNKGEITETGAPEIRFNGRISSETPIEKYIEISPNFGGTWERVYTYSYRFEHSKHFDKNTTYKVTVKKGLKDENGNELKDDYSFEFSISNDKDIGASISMLNNYHTSENLDMTLDLYFNMKKELTLKSANLRIIDLGSKEEYVKALHNYLNLEELKKYYNSKEYNVSFEKNLKDVIESEYNNAKKTENYWYDREVPVDTNVSFSEQGYFLAILDINSDLSASLFQVNDSTASCTVLSENNFMILYKGKNGQDNSVDVFLNDEKLGTTDKDGLLYLESFRSKVSKLNKDVNYIEFKTGTKDFICDVTSQIYYDYKGENALTSLAKFNNGYIYIDRNTYKPGETIHYWGYAKNRKLDNVDASLKIVANWDDELAEIPLKLSEVGTFEGEFKLDDVDKETMLTLELCINERHVSYRYAEIRTYELKQYNISLEPERKSYITGEEATINITAETYDGTPLKDLEFTYETGSNYYYYDDNSKKVDGSVKTDNTGKATINVKLELAKEADSIQSKSTGVSVLNSYIDGEQQRLYFNVYPYKHYAEGKSKFIVDENKYYLSFKEYESLNNDVPANDSIKVVAKAFKTVRTVTGSRYNKYTKEMEDVVKYEQVAQPSYNKTFTVSMKNGEGEYTLENYSTDKNCYYNIYAYLITDTEKELALSYNGAIYASRYKTIKDETIYEDEEFVDPIINSSLIYRIGVDRNDKLKVSDEVKFYLHDDEGRKLNDYSKFEFYTLVVSSAGNNIYRCKGERPHFVFEEDMGANVYTYTICYDTVKAYVPTEYRVFRYTGMMINDTSYISNASAIALCKDEISLDVEATFDKEVYSPRDEAIVKIKVTDKGKGVLAGINLSAVDTAFIDANGKVESSIFNSIYNNYGIYTNYTTQNTTSRMATKNTMAVESAMVNDMADAGGGGGDEEGSFDLARDDLRVTAFFESVVTNENGEAEVRIKLPDNITEWTIEIQAVSDNYKAYSEEKKIKVSKDFFVNVNHKDRYLAGEHFAFDIKSFSKTLAGKNVDFDIEILDKNDKAVDKGTVSAKVQDVLSYKISNPLKEAGTYKLKLTGKCEGEKDTLIDEITVADSLFDTTVREDIELKVGDKITIVSNKGYIYALNKDVAKILPTLYELQFMFNRDRNDVRVISSEAGRIFSNLVSGKGFEYSSKSYGDDSKIIFKVMDNSSDDARLALRMLSTKAVSVDSDEVLDKIEVRLGESARAWAAVNMGSISLSKLRDFKDDVINNKSSYKAIDALYLALAFADFGSDDDALELYNIVKDEISQKDENEYELKVILTIKLNLKEAETLYNEYMSNKENMLPENYNFIKLYYVQNALLKSYKKGEIVLKVNGKEEKVEIGNVGLTRKLIAGKDDIAIVSMTDNLSFMIEQYKPVDFGILSKGKYIISKKYSSKNAKLGDIVDVTITIDNKKLYEDGYKYSMEVQDAIPNNMTYVEYLIDEGTSGYIRNQDGQKISIGFWNPYDPKWNPSKTTSTLKYRVRVTNDGEQFEPGTIIIGLNNKIIDGIK
jgi:hypothetical protein